MTVDAVEMEWDSQPLIDRMRLGRAGGVAADFSGSVKCVLRRMVRGRLQQSEGCVHHSE